MPDSIQNVKIRFTTENSGLDQSNKALQDLTASEKILVKGFEDLNNAVLKVNESILAGAKKSNGETQKATGIINNLKANIQQLQVARDKSNDPGKIKIYNDAITAQNAKLKTLTTSTDDLNKKSTTLNNTYKTIGASIVAAFSVSAILGFGKQIINITGEFEKLRAVLTNTLGSQSLADSALEKIKNLAATTNFGVLELTNAYVKLANSGFEPTVKQLTALADLTNSTGKTFDQLAEAILDANTDQFIRLKEFGIKASREGDKISFLFKGVRTEVDRNSASITKYLVGLGNIPGVMGATAAIAQTVTGKISNLGDAYDFLLNTIGSQQSGFFKTAIQGLTDFASFLSSTLRSVDQFNERLVNNASLHKQNQLNGYLQEERKLIGDNEDAIVAFNKRKAEEFALAKESNEQSAQEIKDKIKNNKLLLDSLVFESEIESNVEVTKKLEQELILVNGTIKAQEQIVHDLENENKQIGIAQQERDRLKNEQYEKDKAKREKVFSQAKSDLDQAEANAIRIEKLEGGKEDRIFSIQQDFNKKREVLFAQHNKAQGSDYESLIIKDKELEAGMTAFYKAELEKRAEEQKQIEINVQNDRLAAIDFSSKQQKTRIASVQNVFLEEQVRALRAGEINSEQYQQNISDLEQDFRVQGLNDDIKVDQEKLLVLKEGTVERADVEKDLLDKKKELLDIEVDNFKKSEDEKVKAAQLRAKNILLIEQKVVKVSLDIVNALFQAQQNRIQTERNDLQGQEKQEIESIKTTTDQGLLARQQARDKELAANVDDKQKQKEINASFTAQEKENQQRQATEAQAIKDKYAKKDLELRIKAAKSNKDQAYFEAALGVAKGIVNATAVSPPYGFILGALVAAEGAVQIAAIKSQPLPKFYKGTESLELGNNPSGIDTIPILANKGERIVPTAINEHLKGISNADLPKLANMWRNQIDYKSITNDIVSGRSGGQQDGQLISEIKSMNKKLDHLKVANITIDKHGIKAFVTTENSKVEFVNNYFRS